MDLRLLKTFCAIVETGSFTKAAEDLGYAQSSVTAQIRALEAELETKLFERMGRQVVLSKSGEQMLAYARQIINLTCEAKAVIAGSMPKGTLIIGAPESLCVYRLPAIIREYRSRYPEVELIVKTLICSDITGYLKNNEIDIAFVIGRELSFPYLIAETLLDEPVAVMGGPEHPLAGKGSISSADLTGEHLILTEKSINILCYRSVFEELLAADGIRPISILEFGSVEAIKKCVTSGLGLTVLPEITVQQELNGGELIDLGWSGPDFQIKTQVVYHKNKWIMPSMLALINLAREKLSVSGSSK